MSLPPAFAAGALYDNLLQRALRQFFARATFETEAIPSVSSDGRLAIEPTKDPSALTVRWFGWRHTLRATRERPFTPHEVRLARAIGSVLAARYRAIFDPRLMAERGDLFRGSIEDRYIGAFLDGEPYRIETTQGRADRIATAIEVLRVAALSSYENRSISSGVLLLDELRDPVRRQGLPAAGAFLYDQALTGVKSFYRLCDGLRTVFLVNRAGLLFDIADLDRWAAEAHPDAALQVPCARAYRAHARATLDSGHVCIVLSPSHEIKVFAEGVQMFTFRNAAWHLLDLAAKYDLWVRAVGNRPLAERLFQAAVDLADAREGALFVVLRDREAAVPQLIAPIDRLDAIASRLGAAAGQAAETGQGRPGGLTRRDLLYLLAGETVTGLDPSVLAAVSRMDGATVTDRSGRLLAVGAILLHPMRAADERDWVAEGARTTAATVASRFGPVLKVSEDGVVSFFDGEPIWDM